MKEQYDFSKGKRGKFYNPEATFCFPIYLEPDVEEFMLKSARAQNTDVQDLINKLLRANIELAQNLKQTGEQQPNM